MGIHIHQPDFLAKGDLLSASAVGTLSILSVGSNNTILTADSTQATGNRWSSSAILSTLALQAGGSTGNIAKVGGTIFDHYADAGNTTTTETDLFSDTVPGSLLSANGQKIRATYGGTFVSSGTATREIRVYFGGTQIFDTGTLSISAGADAWTVNVLVIRDSGSSVRCNVWANVTGAALNAFDAYTAISGLTLTNTQVLKVTGQAAGVGAATNDIVAKLGVVDWLAAA